MKELKIGRASDCDIIVPDPSVSRLHAFFIINGDAFSIRDNNSTNGTYINGQRVTGTRALLKNDILKVGDTVLPWRKYIPAGNPPAVATTRPATASTTLPLPERKKRKPSTAVLLLMAAILIAVTGLLAFFFIRSADDERRIIGTWSCPGCPSLKSISFNKYNRQHTLSYTRVQPGAIEEVVQGDWIMNAKDSILTLTPGLVGGNDSLNVAGQAGTVSYKFNISKNTLKLTRLNNGEPALNTTLFQKE